MSSKKRTPNRYKYYVINISDMLNPFAYSTPFLTKAEAINVIITHLRFNFRDNNVISGKDIKRFRVPIRWKRLPKPTKYVYPDERVHWQKRKTYRTVFRRKLKRLLAKEEKQKLLYKNKTK